MRRKISMVLFLVMVLSASVYAAGKGTLTLQSTAEKEVTTTDEQGRKTTTRIPVSATSVVPGEEVIFTTRYENVGKETATGVVVNNPVPDHMTYVAGSAEGKDTRVEFSADGGKTYAPASRLKIKDKTGKERQAAASDYTHIRWSLEKPLLKGGKGSVSFRARVK